MLYRGRIILILLTGVISKGFSQDISHQVLVPVAFIVDLDYYSVNQTVGEPVVEIFEKEFFTLTQGFHQPSITITGPEPPEGSGVMAYPNPVTDILKVELFGIEKTDFEIAVYGMNGSVFLRKEISCGNKYWQIEEIDMSLYRKGVYFVHVMSADKRISRYFKIEKM